MKLYFYRGKEPNFGDELNTWLLPKVFPNFFDDDNRTLFLGIGSTLSDQHPPNCQKIVFGTGFGGYTAPPQLDVSWTISCVRGPRTAKVFGLGQEKVAGDAAILINRYRNRQQPPRSRRIAFMPHFESLSRGNWQKACSLAGLHFIDPRGPVDEILSDIGSSSSIITEAMHGAIVADALRIPWLPALPLHASHRFKWFDWAEALDIKLNARRLAPSSAQEAFVSLKQRHSYRLDHPKGSFAIAAQCADAIFTTVAAARLWQLARKEPMLSDEVALNRALEKLETSAAQIKKDFAG
jgi:polysaccharide pyruvyl transferase